MLLINQKDGGGRRKHIAIKKIAKNTKQNIKNRIDNEVGQQHHGGKVKMFHNGTWMESLITTTCALTNQSTKQMLEGE